MVISMFLQYMSVPYHLRSEATKRGGGEKKLAGRKLGRRILRETICGHEIKKPMG